MASRDLLLLLQSKLIEIKVIMKGLMRMLMMFGPMIFRQFQKYQRKKASQQSSAKPVAQIDKEQAVNEAQNSHKG